MFNIEVVCKGSYALGTACGMCARCMSEKIDHLPDQRLSDDVTRPVTYAPEPERITRVGITRRVDNLNDLELELQEDAARFSDFTPVCKHHFDYFPARHIWIVFRCPHCGKTYEPDDVCKMLNAGMLGVEE